jgi:tetratricopeptide (TPR) repeat protein
MTVPVTRRHTSILVVVLALIMLILALPSRTVVAAPPDQSPDQLGLSGLKTEPLDPSNVASGMRIETEVSYRLGSVQDGYLALFTFEDSSNTASGQSTPIPISMGNGKVTLDIEYEPGPKVQTLNLLIGLFGADKRLIGWLATNPLPTASLAGRLEFQEAMDARTNGDNALAVERLTKAIDLSPQAGSLYYWRGDTLLRMGRYDEAVADYDSALKLMPQHVASMVGRGIAEVWKQEWQGGIDDLSAAIDMGTDQGPLTAWAHRARGVAYAALGQASEAIADYEAYLALTPDAEDRSQVEGWIIDLGGSPSSPSSDVSSDDGAPQ